MRKRWAQARIRLTLAAALGLMCFTPPVQQLAEYPGDITIPLGQKTVLPMGLPGNATTSDGEIVQVHSSPTTNHVAVISRDLGEATVSTHVFGFVPWKAVRVHVVPQEVVYVGGQSIGIKLRSAGVMVVGFQRLGPDQVSPAAQAHLKVGDLIQQIDAHPVHTAQDLRKWTHEEMEGHSQLRITVRRGKDDKVLKLTPFVDSKGVQHLGLFVRDKASGVGTLTFYDPAHHRFGALGHVITDVDTGLAIEGTGSLYEATVSSVIKGTAGRPGEKRGRFAPDSNEVGFIDKNTPFGIFGTMEDAPKHSYLSNPMPVALPKQVHEGPAKLLTVLHGQTVEQFDVQIENLVKQEQPNTKSMIVRVTDPKLLRETGGIVQGMSGSPLIQDGRLIGAVTHVFVSDPTRGYGVYANWMLKESDDMAKEGESNQASAALAKGRRTVEQA
ncbi:SpoIVB peptidase [Alicyclobacillus tolerans]|uniref:SpoIVB peptidase n=1 Tax=Alicyclobacillus tolerans TaxID=90970 RepID=UPI001F00F49A|nr:SpoIVB peptidase [Alicyclobacillus tolerans]MCF8563609.1 SpoIVB peptidase [Alicyclobacillus tolerans]